MHWLRRSLFLGLLAGLGAILFGRLRRPSDADAQAPAGPSDAAADAATDVAPVQRLPEPPPVLTDTLQILVEPGPAASDDWVAPLPDRQCPDGYPIKANAGSGIYHVPGGRFHARTKAERCYARPEDAEADGYRRAKA